MLDVTALECGYEFPPGRGCHPLKQESSEGAGLAGKMRSLVWDVAFAAPLKCPSGDVEPQLVAWISASEPGARGECEGKRLRG